MEEIKKITKFTDEEINNIRNKAQQKDKAADLKEFVNKFDERKNMKKLYVLKCANDKYYVGTTIREIKERVEEHFSNCGSEWTRKYKPISVVETINICDGSEEDIWTKKYMRKYGITNVRGGSYSKIILDDYKIKALEDEFCTADDLCFKCGKSGHFSSECKSNIWYCEYCDEEFKTLKLAEEHEKKCKIKKSKNVGSCKRCGRNGHDISNCYASTDIDGYDISDSDTSNDSDFSDDDNACFRCGKYGHYANKCRAKTSVDGKILKRKNPKI